MIPAQHTLPLMGHVSELGHLMLPVPLLPLFVLLHPNLTTQINYVENGDRLALQMVLVAFQELKLVAKVCRHSRTVN